MKFAVLLAGLLLSTSSAAWSQASATPPPAATESTVKLDLARQLVELSGGEKQISAQVDALYGTMFSKMAERMPPENAQLLSATETAMLREIHTLVPAMINISVSAYARNFTEQELRDILAFRRSPAGQTLTQKAPLIQREAMAEMMPLIMQDMPKMMHTTVDEICKEQSCTPKMREVIDGAVQAALGQTGGAQPAPIHQPTAS